MMAWPEDHARVRLFRYEDLVGNEVDVFNQMFEFFGFSAASRLIGRFNARRHRAAKQQAKSKHIRDPNSGQWRQYCTPELTRRFNGRHGDLIEKLGYATT